jgi:hypothetical protein
VWHELATDGELRMSGVILLPMMEKAVKGPALSLQGNLSISDGRLKETLTQRHPARNLRFIASFGIANNSSRKAVANHRSRTPTQELEPSLFSPHRPAASEPALR